MYDLVSYNEKHNLANGENNADGSGDNHSWNCGWEGECEDLSVNELRLRQMKNFFTILLTSRGVPMLLSGDEFANTQYGNNNAYCQDNEVSYLNWGNLFKHKDLYNYVRRLVAFRRAHPVLRESSYVFGHNGTGYPELSFHGLTPWELDEKAQTLCFAYLFTEDHVKYQTEQDAFLYVAVNAWWEPVIFHLPIIPSGMKWHLGFQSHSFSSDVGTEPEYPSGELFLEPRSTAILIAK